jgi:hypothetical protein
LRLYDNVTDQKLVLRLFIRDIDFPCWSTLRNICDILVLHVNPRRSASPIDEERPHVGPVVDTRLHRVLVVPLNAGMG